MIKKTNNLFRPDDFEIRKELIREIAFGIHQTLISFLSREERIKNRHWKFGQEIIVSLRVDNQKEGCGCFSKAGFDISRIAVMPKGYNWKKDKKIHCWVRK